MEKNSKEKYVKEMEKTFQRMFQRIFDSVWKDFKKEGYTKEQVADLIAESICGVLNEKEKDLNFEWSVERIK